MSSYDEIPDDELQAEYDAHYSPRVLTLEEFVERKYAAALRMRPELKEAFFSIELHNPERPRLTEDWDTKEVV